MSFHDEILAAYHRKIARHLKETGVSYPKTRATCVEDDGTITDTDVIDPKVVATWTEDAGGRIRITLV